MLDLPFHYHPYPDWSVKIHRHFLKQYLFSRGTQYFWCFFPSILPKNSINLGCALTVCGGHCLGMSVWAAYKTRGGSPWTHVHVQPKRSLSTTQRRSAIIVSYSQSHQTRANTHLEPQSLLRYLKVWASYLEPRHIVFFLGNRNTEKAHLC